MATTAPRIRNTCLGALKRGENSWWMASVLIRQGAQTRTSLGHAGMRVSRRRQCLSAAKKLQLDVIVADIR